MCSKAFFFCYLQLGPHSMDHWVCMSQTNSDSLDLECESTGPMLTLVTYSGPYLVCWSLVTRSTKSVSGRSLTQIKQDISSSDNLPCCVPHLRKDTFRYSYAWIPQTLSQFHVWRCLLQVSTPVVLCGIPSTSYSICFTATCLYSNWSYQSMLSS